MFGGAGITSSWSNQNQQQQPQSTGSAFGQPAFGQSAFGSGTGAFGQNQQQPQQPQVNPMFGNLATPSTNTSSGFGAFGSGSGTTGTSAFGATKPATGFGAFGGGTGTFGSGGAFGQNASASTSTPSAFGQTSTGTSAFGAGAGLFGQNKPTSTFGSSTTTSTDAPVPPVTTGTANPPWSATSDKDQNGTTMCNYQTISAMPAYRGTSLEELRCQDYAQGRKTASTGGAFGQSSFGGSQVTQPAGTGLFGAQQPTQQTSAFGVTPNAGGTAFGTFGQNQGNQGTTSAFSGGGAFGQPQQSQQQPAQAQSAFGGAFGQQQTGSAFGGTSAFNKPASAFGSFGTPSGTSAFGGGGAFGQASNQQQQQQQHQQQTSVFGQPATNTGLGAFGAATANKSVFGQPSQPAGQTTNAFGGTNIFGQPNQAQQTQPQASSLFGGGTFGSNTNQQQQQQQQQQPNPLFGSGTTQNQGGSGLFNTGSGLFGANTNQQQPQSQAGQNTLGLFGNKPAGQTQSLFGTGFGQQQQPANPVPQSNIFGGTPNQQGTQQNAFGSSLFGNKPLGTSMSTGQTTGLFGGSGNTFTASASVPGAQGTLTASISQPIATNLPIFSMLPPGPQAVSLDQSTKKKASFFVDVPTRSPVPRMQLGFSPASSKLRGFASSGSVSSVSGLNFSQGAPLALSLSKPADIKPSDSLLGRSASPSLGSGQKRSVKKLIFDKKVVPSDLYVKSPSNTSGRGKVTFSPALSIAQREKEAEERSQSTKQFIPSSSPAPRSHNPTFASQDASGCDGADIDSSNTLDEGEYWVKPSMEILKGCGYDQISSFKDLVVGREGYGEIHLLEPVDLTGLPKLGSLLGDVVRFDDKECSVYPDSEDVDKPPPGSGLNVRARISLKRCWAVDKANREPIKDETHPQAIKHLKRLKNMKDTHFESFDMKDGTWTFTVDHF
ncbi:nucleoporin autopeptidase-domain-containing protein [Desarmillaria tabescens]|uniref:Nucleoporin autopeptidase-domain-containing protein n=1 Tax=Armillaria tabescens TaxID=1929756 RepID=A0AA39N9Z8_ARMTA|nr:nucleoporin autopeptidase-domain-containing protein [Desarmillaria tabescens]KAK0461765.1 nucleoporin autopeptidase-domain-containing protein [Desarmillaria tabescens]